MLTVCTATETLQHFATETVYVFCVILIINSLHLPTQHQTPALCKVDRICFLKVVSELLHVRVIQMSVSFQRVEKSQQKPV